MRTEFGILFTLDCLLFTAFVLLDKRNITEPFKRNLASEIAPACTIFDPLLGLKSYGVCLKKPFINLHLIAPVKLGIFEL